MRLFYKASKRSLLLTIPAQNSISYFNTNKIFLFTFFLFYILIELDTSAIALRTQ